MTNASNLTLDVGVESATTSWRKSASPYVLLFTVYLLATWMTEPHFMADTVGYADAAVSGDSKRMWEFGHLLWRPWGRLGAAIFAWLLRLWVGTDARAAVVLVLVTTSWVAGFISVLSLAGLLRHICRREWVVMVASIGFIFAHGFLNFAQAGTPYVPGLALLLLGMNLLSKGGHATRPWLVAFFAGAALASAVGMWFLYILALPGAIVMPLVLLGVNRQRLRLVLLTMLFCSLFGALIFGTAMGILGIHTFEGFYVWVLNASHGATSSGFTRMVFGFARSFINMGNDGVLVKRFMLQDPYNPVSLADIFRLSLWKLGLFYVFLAAIAVNLVRSNKGRRVLGLLILSALPIICFAVLWQGGDIERYLPLYPFVFLAFAYSLESEKSIALLNGVAVLFVAAAALTSLAVMAKPVLHRQEAAVMSRLQELQPRLKPQSTVITVHQQDELWKANYSFPFNPFFRQYANLVYPAAALGTVHTLRWREDFASHALSVWNAGGDVWLSKRLLHSRPRPEWNWVEGFAPMSWSELHNFFSQMEMAEDLGGEEGFVLLVHSQRNEQILRPLASDKETK